VGLMSYIPQESLVPSARRSSGGIPELFEDIVVTSHFNDLDGTIKIIEQHRHELAAVIMEPLQRVIAPEPGFLEGVREVTAQCGIPLIFDEVVILILNRDRCIVYFNDPRLGIYLIIVLVRLHITQVVNPG
ncbi:MAG: aminotransferase class III-fold pyridoxal phosphate-dependent enzyme, partial [Candidatus Marinimicrobia bacterium]|nr:aminotransferase class III-fold pyridoxal phosphate-dependent enzyme [Candidatus Neomarinimicrobiota bacterium]